MISVNFIYCPFWVYLKPTIIITDILGKYLDIEFAIYENGEWNKNPFILSGAEPNYTTVSNYSVCINVPNDYVVIATGMETKDESNNYTITGNNLREFAMVVGNNIEKSSATYNGVEINNYYYDYSGNKKYNDYSLKIAVESFELYSNLIGEYPYEEYNSLGHKR